MRALIQHVFFSLRECTNFLYFVATVDFCSAATTRGILSKDESRTSFLDNEDPWEAPETLDPSVKPGPSE